MIREVATYSFVNAKVRAMLSYLISPELFARLLEAKDAYELIDNLKGTAYAQVFEGISSEHLDLRALERALRAHDLAVYRKVYDSLSSKKEKEFVHLLLQRYELEELKVALRIWHKKLAVDPADYLFLDKIAFDIDFKKLLASQTVEELILFLDKTPYKEPLLRAKDKFKERDSVFYLEIALDSDYYQRLTALVEQFASLDRSVARKVLGIEIDIENINWLIRLKKYYAMSTGEIMEWFIPGGASLDKSAVKGLYAADGVQKTIEGVALGPYAKIKDLLEDNIHLIEGFLYEILLRQVKRALAGFPFTIGTVLGYLLLKRKETRNIVSLLYAKYYGWKREDIQPLLNAC